LIFYGAFKNCGCHIITQAQIGYMGANGIYIIDHFLIIRIFEYYPETVVHVGFETPQGCSYRWDK
jgi:hypothetical protein